MEELDTQALRALPVFQGVFEPNMEELLGCLYTRRREYAKGEVILDNAQYQKQIGLVLEGSVDVLTQAQGEGQLIARLSSPDMFGCGFFQRDLLHRIDGLGAPQDKLADPEWVQIAVAAEDCTVLLFEHEHVITPCWFCCFYHTRFIDNAIHIAAAQNKKYLQNR